MEEKSAVGNNLRAAHEWLSATYNAALTSPLAREADRALGHLTEKWLGHANEYSKAMDANYLRDHIGGGWHRLFDGGHTVWGSWNAVRGVNPSDDGYGVFVNWLREYTKDLVTPNGMPIVTFDKSWFDHTSGVLREHLGVSTAWIKDMVSLNATEALGAASGLAALLISLKSKDPDRFAQLLGSLGVSASAAGNPLALAFVLMAALGAVAHEGIRDKNVSIKERVRRMGRRVKSSAFPVGKGVTLTGAALIAGHAVLATGMAAAAPVSLGVGLAVGIGGNYAISAAERRYRKWQNEACLRALYTEYRRAPRLLMSPVSAHGTA
jgi:hypothetical protein